MYDTGTNESHLKQIKVPLVVVTLWTSQSLQLVDEKHEYILKHESDTIIMLLDRNSLCNLHMKNSQKSIKIIVTSGYNVRPHSLCFQ